MYNLFKVLENKILKFVFSLFLLSLNFKIYCFICSLDDGLKASQTTQFLL